MRRFAVLTCAFALLAGCGLPGDSGVTTTVSPADLPTTTNSAMGTTTSSSVSSTTTLPPPTTVPPTTTTTLSESTTVVESDGRWALERLGLEPGIPIAQPDNFQTMPEPIDSFGFVSPYPRARISSRFELSEEARDRADIAPSPNNDLGYTITYIPGFTIWDYPNGPREVDVDDGDLWTLNPDGTWSVSEPGERPPFGPMVDWSDTQGVYEGFHTVGFTVEGYERLVGVETARLRWKDAPEGMWADLWVDAEGIVMRFVFDLGLEEAELAGNEWWMIWDVETLDPQDIGPLPPSS